MDESPYAVNIPLQEQFRKNAQEAEAKSAFKLHQPVIARRVLSSSLKDGGLYENPPDENDPNLYFNSRVVGWDLFGRIQIATVITDNVHCTEWCWSEEKLQPYPEGKWDWYTDRQAGFAKGSDGYWDKERFWQEVGSEIYFMWEDPSWKTDHPAYSDNYGVGETVRAVLEGPHINYGDWIVRYEKNPKDMWITRVLNERQMWKRE